MSKKKKIVVSIIAVVLVCALAGGGILAARNANAKTITVVPVSDLSYSMYNEESMEGQVTTSVTQKVKLDKDSIIEKVYVNVGDHVRRGDKLISFDMTLKEMELEIAVLTRQQQQQNLKKAKERLTSLQNGGPIEDTSTSGSTGPSSLGDEDQQTSTPLFGDGDESDDLNQAEEPGSTAYVEPEETEPSVAYGWLGNSGGLSMVIATAFPSFLSFDAEAGDVPGFTPELPEKPEETPEPTETPGNTVTHVLGSTLTSLEERVDGTGTKEDPYVFVCSSKTGKVVVMGSFLNEAAGYDAKGEELLKEEGYWFRIEFHEDDTYEEEDREKSLVGYYVRNGGLLSNPVDPEDEVTYTLDHATMPEYEFDPENVVTPTPIPEEEPDDDWGDDWYDDYDDGDGDSGLSREDAIKEQKRLIADLELQIKASDIKISRLKRNLEKKTTVSGVNGTVTKMGDPVTGTYEGEAFMEIQSDGGYYVKGSISELMLDTLKVGDTLTCMSYESGMSFQAEITEISEYPGESGGYYGSGNTNSSFYPFIAAVKDDVELKNGEYANIMLNDVQGDSENSMEITKAFVRSEGGQYYVYKDEDGKLVKQIVQAKVSTDGYSVTILGGLSSEDKIAFPYGKGVEEGAKTKEGTMDEIYGY